jgi:hypothetical protein
MRKILDDPVKDLSYFVFSAWAAAIPAVVQALLYSLLELSHRYETDQQPENHQHTQWKGYYLNPRSFKVYGP